jgi:hypothetical protein
VNEIRKKYEVSCFTLTYDKTDILKHWPYRMIRYSLIGGISPYIEVQECVSGTPVQKQIGGRYV